MKFKFKKSVAVLLCAVAIFMMGSVNFAYAANGDSGENFCKIKRTTATVLINRFEKLEFYADYHVDADKNAELIWTVDGEGVFLNGETDKTAKGENVELLFLDDTTVKLQLVSSDGEVISEDEVALKRYGGNSSFFEKIKYGFLTALIVIVGIFGGTVGPWIGSLL